MFFLVNFFCLKYFTSTSGRKRRGSDFVSLKHLTLRTEKVFQYSGLKECERIFPKKLTEYLEKFDLLSVSFTVFFCFRSTSDIMIVLSDRIGKVLNISTTSLICHMSDVSSTFDTVQRLVFLHWLRSYNISVHF